MMINEYYWVLCDLNVKDTTECLDHILCSVNAYHNYFLLHGSRDIYASKKSVLPESLGLRFAEGYVEGDPGIWHVTRGNWF